MTIAIRRLPLSLNQVTKYAEPLQYIDKVAKVPIVIQRQVAGTSLNQATKHVEISQTQHTDKVAAVLTMTQRQVPATKHAEISKTQYINKVAAVLIVMQRHVPATKHVETPQVQFIDEFAAVLVVIQRKGPQSQTVLKTVEGPACAVHRQSAHACDQAEEIISQKRIPERVGQLDDVPVPQILNEIVELVKAAKNAPQERISGKIGEQIDDTVPVDQLGDQVRRDPTGLCGVATRGSHCGEDVGSLAVKALVIMQINQVTKHDAVSQIRHTNKERQAQMAAVPANGIRRPNMKQCARLKPCSGYGHRC